MSKLSCKVYLFRLLLTLTFILILPGQAQAPAAHVLHIPYPPPAYRVMTVEVTAYTYGCGNGDGFTATMTRPRRGVCAVDPKVIPLGTELWVPGYGWARAEDTGGAIKGAKVDLFMESREEALRWGRKVLEVRVCERN